MCSKAGGNLGVFGIGCHIGKHISSFFWTLQPTFLLRVNVSLTCTTTTNARPFLQFVALPHVCFQGRP